MDIIPPDPAAPPDAPGAPDGGGFRRLPGTIAKAVVALAAAGLFAVPFLIGLNWLFAKILGSDRLEFLSDWLQLALLVVSGAALAWIFIGRWQAAERWLGALHEIVGTLSGILIGLFAIAIAGDLLLRMLAWGTLPGMHEVMEYALYISVFIAAPWVLRLGAHIRVDLMLTALPNPVSRWLEFAIDLFGALLCLGLAYYALLSVFDAYDFGSMQRKTYVVHDGFLRSFLVASFVLLAAEFAFRVHRAREIDPHTDAKQGGF